LRNKKGGMCDIYTTSNPLTKELLKPIWQNSFFTAVWPVRGREKGKKEEDSISSQPTCSKKKSLAKLVPRVVTSVDLWYA